ncbi:alpha/beta fold hydrolase [Rhizorhabdus dicambivorans]|uniref:Alpha/beta hydrolase n=1 Tax=Rhizorhabdus dicambivorans TaxID=1850238 RepID=A0A2A4FZD4_9SPHN|nr:alpha/beta hydrolase [Rhizorhabdus dicambivorans]ATE63664.1 alpha/beta hydrolase [Rhizorhabdus dicambivorans]PCE42792.1 alpha/beta hydrolase [Rhizorhabdus dicambivorans]
MLDRDGEKTAAVALATATAPAPARGRAAAPGWEFADAPARSVSIDGVEISYRLWDSAPADAPTLLFLHGFRAHSRWWDHILPFFRDDYRVATMDFSGLGDSGWRDRYTMRGFAREILAVIEDAGLAPVTIVAHSFGGSPAAYASLLQPEAISHAIIIDTRLILGGVPEPAQIELQAFNPGKRVYKDMDEARSRYRLIPSSGDVDAEIIDHIARHSARPAEGGWTWKFDPSFDPQLTDDPDRLVPPGVTMPIDYIYGDRSGVVTPALADLMLSQLPSCHAPIVIPHSDHHVLLEQPVALVAVLRALLLRGPRL